MNQVEFLGLLLGQCNPEHFAANPFKKGTDARMEMNKFYCCKESAT